MNIYIPDIELPKDEPRTYTAIVMYVGADGKLRAECEGTHEVTIVPPHGRLIDADEIREKFFCGEDVKHDEIHTTLDAVLYFIDGADTVIPADKDGET